RLADMHRGAMHRGKTRGDLDGADGICRRHRPHGDDNGTMEGPRGGSRDGRAIHRHRDPASHVAKLDAVLDEGLLERERAAKDKGDEIIARMAPDVRGLVDEVAAPEHPIAREIGTDIEIVAE